MKISDVFNRFIDYYAAYFGFSNREGAVARINQGDCGTAAIAVGTVLQHNGFPVVFRDNINHAFITIGTLAYDCANLEGVKEEILNEQYGSLESQIVTPEILIGAYMPYDACGAVLLKRFLEHYQIPVYPFTLNVVENIGEFDDPEYVKELEDRLNLFLEGQK